MSNNCTDLPLGHRCLKPQFLELACSEEHWSPRARIWDRLVFCLSQSCEISFKYSVTDIQRQQQFILSHVDRVPHLASFAVLHHPKWHSLAGWQARCLWRGKRTDLSFPSQTLHGHSSCKSLIDRQTDSCLYQSLNGKIVNHKMSSRTEASQRANDRLHAVFAVLFFVLRILDMFPVGRFWSRRGCSAAKYSSQLLFCPKEEVEDSRLWRSEVMIIVINTDLWVHHSCAHP